MPENLVSRLPVIESRLVDTLAFAHEMKEAQVNYSVCDAADVEAINGVFRPIRRTLGVRGFGINQEDWPPNADQHPEHDHAEDGQEEVYYCLGGSGRVVVDGEDVDLKPGRYVRVAAEATRRVYAGPEGLSIICVGAPVGRPYEAG